MNTQPRRARWAVASALGLAVLLVAAGCRTADSGTSTAVTTTQPAKDGGTIVMAVDQETDGWNPVVSQWTNAAYWVGSSVIEPLTTYDEHGETVMWLAESITPTVPGKFDSWQIKVKPGITFHNGEVLDADVVKANLELLTNGKALAGIALGTRFVDFPKVDDRTVQVNLTLPWADFPAFMAGPTGMMMATEQINAPYGGLGHPIGTGPFVFDSWVPNESLKVHKNTKYWRPGEPHLDAIEFRPIVDNKKAISALQNGDVDLVVTSKAGDIDLAGQGYEVSKDFKTEKTFIVINTEQHPDLPANPLRNLHARRALALATDRAAVRAQVGAGQELETSTQIMVTGTPWAVPEDQTAYYAFDVDKAKQEVAAYQAETGGQPFEFELNTTNAPDDLAIAQMLSDQWKAAGITARVRPKDTQPLVLDTVTGKFDAVIQRNYGYPNPDNVTPLLLSSNAKGPGALSVNFMQLKDPVIDQSVAAIMATTDRNVQREQYLTITRQMNEAAVNQWLYDTPFAVLRIPAVKGTETLETHAFGNSMPKPWLWGGVWRE